MRIDTKEYFEKLRPFFDDDTVPSLPITSKEEYEEIVVKNLIRCGAIPKKDLIVGRTYYGDCRNAGKAVWNGDKFTYSRYKFGMTYDEDINHFEDDDGHDVFVPIALVGDERQWEKDIAEIMEMEEVEWDDYLRPNEDTINAFKNIFERACKTVYEKLRCYPTFHGALQFSIKGEKGKFVCQMDEKKLAYFVKTDEGETKLNTVDNNEIQIYEIKRIIREIL